VKQQHGPIRLTNVRCRGKPDFAPLKVEVCKWHQTDLKRLAANVCSRRKSGHRSGPRGGPKMTHSRRRANFGAALAKPRFKRCQRARRTIRCRVMGRRRHEATPISTWARQCRDRVAARGACAAARPVRVIGVLVAGTADDPEHQARVEAFRQVWSDWVAAVPGNF
jgi:hypothetical protein